MGDRGSGGEVDDVVRELPDASAFAEVTWPMDRGVWVIVWVSEGSEI